MKADKKHQLLGELQQQYSSSKVFEEEGCKGPLHSSVSLLLEFQLVLIRSLLYYELQHLNLRSFQSGAS
jgi:hypothetical protein